MDPKLLHPMADDLRAAEEVKYSAWARLQDTAVSISFAPFDWALRIARDDWDLFGLDIGPVRFSLRWPWAKMP